MILIPRKPEFWLKKPSYPVKLKQNHWLSTERLVFAFIGKDNLAFPQETASDIVYRDGNPDFFHTPSNFSLKRPNPLSGNGFRIAIKIRTAATLSSGYDTFFYTGHFTSSSDQSGIWLGKQNANEFSVIQRNNSGNKTVICNTLTGGQEATYKIAVIGSNQNLYVTHVDTDTQYSETTTSTTGSYLDTDNVKVGRAEATPGDNRYTWVEYVYVYLDITESLDMVNAVVEAPYQHLTQLGKQFYYVADSAGTHEATAALVGQSGVITGDAVHPHIASAALVGQSGAVTGAATHPHVGSAALVGQAGAVTGAANTNSSLTSSGDLVGQAGLITGTASVTAAPGTHNATAALVGQAGFLSGTAQKFALHTATGALTGQSGVVRGQAYLGGVPVVISTEKAPIVRTKDFKTLINQTEPKKPKHPTYIFSNERQFLEDDDYNPYN